MGRAGKTQEAAEGVVTFNDPTPIKPKIEVNLDSELIAFVAKTTEQEPEIAELIAMLEGVYVRSYSGDAASFDPMIHYYERVLKKRDWEVFAKIKEDSEKIQIWMLLNIETIDGLFVMVTGETETHLVNIVGHLHPEQIGELLGNLKSLGAEIPQLNSLDDASLQDHKDGFGIKKGSKPSHLTICRSGASPEYTPANFLPKINQVQFVSEGCAIYGIDCAKIGKIVPKLAHSPILDSALVCPLK